MGSIGTFGLPATGLLDNFGVANYAMPLANTEYTFSLPSGIKNFSFQTREGGLIKVAKTLGQSGITYFSIYPGVTYNIESVTGNSTITIYVQSPKASQTLEVIYWT